MNKLDTRNYIDATNEWLKNAKPNILPVKEQLFFEYEGCKYYVDGKNVVLDYSNKELEIAIWLKNTFGGEIYMLPRVNKPDGIKTADYLWNNEKWDLKIISTSGRSVIDNRLNGRKAQSTNMIIDISNNFLTNYEINMQIERVYSSPSRDWVDKIILIRDNELIKIYKRKR